MATNIKNLAKVKGRYQYENATARLSKVDVSEVTRNLEKFGPAVKDAVINYLQAQCPALEHHMKSTARWKNRTGDLRRTLTARVAKKKNYVGIVLAMNMEYGKYLEYGTNRIPKNKYNILHPTKEEKFPEVVRGMKGLLKYKRYMKWM